MSTSSVKSQDLSGLRERNNNAPITNGDNGTARSGSEPPSEDFNVEKNKKTFGRTPNGTSK